MLLDAEKASYSRSPTTSLTEVLETGSTRLHGSVRRRGEKIARVQVEPLRRAIRGVLALRALARRKRPQGARAEADLQDLPANANRRGKRKICYLLEAAPVSPLRRSPLRSRISRPVDSYPIQSDVPHQWLELLFRTIRRRRRDSCLSTFFDLFGNGSDGRATRAAASPRTLVRPAVRATTTRKSWCGASPASAKWVTAKLAAQRRRRPRRSSADGRTLISPRASKSENQVERRPGRLSPAARERVQVSSRLDVPDGVEANMWLRGRSS